MMDFMEEIGEEYWSVDKKRALDAGVYLLQIRSNKGMRTLKVLVK